MLSIKRFFFKITRASRSRGFGIQSPFAYSFVREVVRGNVDFTDSHTFTSMELSKDDLRLKKFYYRLNHFLLNHDNINDVLVIEGIHNSRKSLFNWNELIKDKTVSVSFDLYYCGVLFFDKKMYKRNYKVMLR